MDRIQIARSSSGSPISRGTTITTRQSFFELLDVWHINVHGDPSVRDIISSSQYGSVIQQGDRIFYCGSDGGNLVGSVFLLEFGSIDFVDGEPVFNEPIFKDFQSEFTLPGEDPSTQYVRAVPLETDKFLCIVYVGNVDGSNTGGHCFIVTLDANGKPSVGPATAVDTSFQLFTPNVLALSSTQAVFLGSHSAGITIKPLTISGTSISVGSALDITLSSASSRRSVKGIKIDSTRFLYTGAEPGLDGGVVDYSGFPTLTAGTVLDFTSVDSVYDGVLGTQGVGWPDYQYFWDLEDSSGGFLLHNIETDSDSTLFSRVVVSGTTLTHDNFFQIDPFTFSVPYLTKNSNTEWSHVNRMESPDTVWDFLIDPTTMVGSRFAISEPTFPAFFRLKKGSITFSSEIPLRFFEVDSDFFMFSGNTTLTGSAVSSPYDQGPAVFRVTREEVLDEYEFGEEVFQ